MNGLERTQRWTLIAILAVGTAIVTFLFLRNPNIGYDALRYFFAAQNLAQGKGYSYRGAPELLFPPGYGVAAYLVSWVVPDPEAALMLVSALAYVLILLASYRVGRALFGARVGLVAAALTALSPTLVKYSHVTLSEALFTLLLLVGFGVYARASRHAGPGAWTVFGALMGSAYLVRPEALMVGGLALLRLALVGAGKGSEAGSPPCPAASRAAAVSVAGMVTALFVLPYMFFLHQHLGRWSVSTKLAANLYLGESLEEGEARSEYLGWEHPELFEPQHQIDVVEYVRSRGWRFLKRVAGNGVAVAREVVRGSFHALLPLLALAGFAVARGFARGIEVARAFLPEARLTWIFAIFMSPMAVLLFLFVADRFVLPYLPLVLLLCARALVVCHERWYGSRPGGAATRWAWIAAGLALVSLLGWLPWVGQKVSLLKVLSTPHAHAGLRSAGLWLREHAGPMEDRPLMCVRKCDIVLFYAGGKREPGARYLTVNPSMSIEDVTQALERGEADYLVLESNYIVARPRLLPLWKDPGSAERYGLVLVHADERSGFQIYRAR